MSANAITGKLVDELFLEGVGIETRCSCLDMVVVWIQMQEFIFISFIIVKVPNVCAVELTAMGNPTIREATMANPNMG